MTSDAVENARDFLATRARASVERSRRGRPRVTAATAAAAGSGIFERSEVAKDGDSYGRPRGAADASNATAHHRDGGGDCRATYVILTIP